MTEPIKLPLRDAIIEGMGWPALKGHIAQDDDLICRIERVVEQATADLRAELAAMTDHWYKARAERDEACAELARLTTLRPASEHDHAGLALWHFASGAATVSRKAQIGSTGWTPLPEVKEPK